MKLFDADNFEKLLVANWTKFLDSSRLMAYVLQKLQEHSSSLDIISSEKIKTKGIKISLSKFLLTHQGFLVWIEFNAPIQGNYAVGTMELLMTLDGEFNFIQMNGNLF